MRISIVTFLAFLVNLSTAQIGKIHSEVQELFGNESLPGLELRKDGNYLVEDKKISDDEIRMIIYNSDSIVVGVAFAFPNDAITESDYDAILNEELPLFQEYKTAIKGDAACRYGEHGLILLNPAGAENVFPISSFVIMTDPVIIDRWTKGIEEWYDE
ncbi:MAG: hypothetical protein EA358_02440 [Flavobacteriales bacterium]|nr:MAG: hypothetical protein EA358_02440 [Flavobacteriales bacterium]